MRWSVYIVVKGDGQLYYSIVSVDLEDGVVGDVSAWTEFVYYRSQEMFVCESAEESVWCGFCVVWMGEKDVYLRGLESPTTTLISKVEVGGY